MEGVGENFELMWRWFGCYSNNHFWLFTWRHTIKTILNTAVPIETKMTVRHEYNVSSNTSGTRRRNTYTETDGQESCVRTISLIQSHRQTLCNRWLTKRVAKTVAIELETMVNSDYIVWPVFAIQSPFFMWLRSNSFFSFSLSPRSHSPFSVWILFDNRRTSI